jgi:hypothetical protein
MTGAGGDANVKAARRTRLGSDARFMRIKSVAKSWQMQTYRIIFEVPSDNMSPSEYVDKVCSMMRLYVLD